MTQPKDLVRWNKSGMEPYFAVRANVRLNRGRVSDALRVYGGPCRIICMFMEITEAVANVACDMQWLFDSEAGGSARVIGAAVDIANAAAGDFFVAKLDGTAIIKATTATGLVHGYWYNEATANGTIVTEGGIDIALATNNLATGRGSLWVYYRPIAYNAAIYAGVAHTSTTSSTSTTTSTGSTSTTTTTTSSTSTTTSTTSTTSSTSSTASTTSSTSSTASTTSTASSTSSTSSTASTTSTASSTSSTSSTASTTSTTSSTSSTASTTSTTSSTSSTTSTTSSTTSTHTESTTSTTSSTTTRYHD